MLASDLLLQKNDLVGSGWGSPLCFLTWAQTKEGVNLGGSNCKDWCLSVIWGVKFLSEIIYNYPWSSVVGNRLLLTGYVHPEMTATDGT